MDLKLPECCKLWASVKLGYFNMDKILPCMANITTLDLVIDEAAGLSHYLAFLASCINLESLNIRY